MAFMEYVMAHPEVVFKIAEENKKSGKVVKTLYGEWKKENRKTGMMNFY